MEAEQVVEKKGGGFGKGKILAFLAVLMVAGVAFAGLQMYLSNQASASFEKDAHLDLLINGQQDTVLYLVDNNLDYNTSITNATDNNILSYSPIITLFGPSDQNWESGLPEVVTYSENGVDLTANLFVLNADGTQGPQIRSMPASTSSILNLMVDPSIGDGTFNKQIFEKGKTVDTNVNVQMHPALANGEYSFHMQVLQDLNSN